MVRLPVDRRGARRYTLPKVLSRKQTLFPRSSTSSFALAWLALLAGCQHASAPARLAPFASDGCSLFPDRAPGAGADWCDCCLKHDLAYWRGGTAPERLDADRALRACVRDASGSPLLAALMLAGVRAGGLPYLPTPFRWGFGWPYGRGYQPVDADEQAQAARLRMAYLARNPALSCGGPRE